MAHIADPLSCADPLLTEAQAAHLMALKQTTLQQWRIRGTGPAYIKLGSAVRYRSSTLQAWLNDRTVSTAKDLPERGREAATVAAGGGFTTAAEMREEDEREAALLARGGGFTTAAGYRASLPLAGSPAAALAMAADEGARA
ncbi:helix-turn-helix transcriptional regulator [Methylobacterium sp. SyP6R]|uniref:helix-turn-helix transcriptional regulator n=1 Tax=Methylobacterium sp. SyP6R TaxID=2718876 RepID=UPI001F2E9584|nr:helix-turn-helix domain-containing protein [Methylobacterium sp. SyP6R]MCF4130262.1 helix-turn-helix domain-containing protein [Methylobacterium sp. SyP6R]